MATDLFPQRCGGASARRLPLADRPLQHTPRFHAKSGVALIMVLSILVVMVILAVGFSIVMRVERLATRNYLDAVRSRHLIDAALARAISEVNTRMGASMYPNFTTFSSAGYTSSTNPPGTITDLFAGAATNYIPFFAKTTFTTNTSVGLVDLEEGANVFGRVGYGVVDCSGLLDANWIGGTNRLGGATPAEISADSETGSLELDIRDGQWNAFLARRNINVRYESIADLWFSQTAARFRPGLTSPSLLTTFSHFPPGNLYNGTITTNLPVVFSATNQAEFVAAASGDPGIADAAMLWTAIQDYLDADNVPQNLSSFATEPVPMLNEVKITHTTTQIVPGSFTYTLNVEPEVWFPFYAATNSNAYNVRVRCDNMGFPVAEQTVLIPGGAYQSPNDYRTLASAVSFSRSIAAGDPWPASAQITISVIQAAGGAVVDRIETFTYNALITVPGAGSVVRQFETDDPRLNWDWNNPVHWQAVNGGTLGAQNGRASFLNSPADPGTADISSHMFVRNGPMNSLGELSFMLYSQTKPWHTIPIVDRPADDTSARIFDVLVPSDEQLDHGRVNPNTPHPEVHGAVLRDAPATFNPTTINDLVSGADARALGVRLRNFAQADFLVNRSDLAYLGSDDIYNALAGHTFGSRLEAECIMQNSMYLYHPRQTLFTIFLHAESVETGVKRAETRAVATVWRDPYPNADGLHPVFVRSIKYLTE